MEKIQIKELKKMDEDAQLAYNYVKQFHKEENISIYGCSLGCTFAVKVARDNEPKQLILEAPFYNLVHLASLKFPLIPFKLILKFKFQTNDFIGEKDKLIPVESSHKLVETVKDKKINLVVLEDGTHHNIFSFKSYNDTMGKLLK